MPLAAAFFLLILLARLPVLLAHLDTWYPFEIHSGTIAQALRDGLDLDWPRLPVAPHIRGNVVFALLAWPLYALLGASGFTLKLVPLLWHAATVALLVRLVERFHRRDAAIAAGALMLLAPPILQKLSVLGLASHLESMLPLLLALWPYLSLIEARREPRRERMAALAFGLAVGFCGFFHLQALLPALILVALLALSRRLGFVPLLPWIALGAAATGGPSLLFAGGNFALLAASFAGRPEPTTDAIDTADAALRVPGLGEKLAGLFRGDFAGALEFGESGTLEAILGGIYAVLLLALAALAVRAAVSAAMDRLRGVAATEPVPAIFLLHPLAVLALYLVSHAHYQAEVAAGATNRHMAPVYFSLLCLAAYGAAGARAPRGGRRTALLLSPLLAIGAAGTVSASRSAPANRVVQRGECYEWFVGQLVHAVGRDPAALVALVDRIDRGQAAFRSLRFALPLTLPAFARRADLEQELARAAKLERRERIFTLTAIGRRLGGASGGPGLDDALNTGLDGAGRAALLHGFGLGLEPPRFAEGAEKMDHFRIAMQRLMKVVPPEYAHAVLEGLGFGQGLIYDPWNGHMRARIDGLEWLPASTRVDFARGFGWGYRQRYRNPPAAAPEGLRALELLPADTRDPFLDGYLARRMPPEAAAFAPSR